MQSQSLGDIIIKVAPLPGKGASRPACRRGSSSRAKGAKGAKGGRRFKGYDYSRGAVFFITFCVAGRKPLFGSVSGDKVVFSPLGLAALEIGRAHV